LCTLVYRWPTMIAISAHVTDSPDTITSHVITCPPMTRRWRHSHRFNRPSQFNHFYITSMSITSTTGQWEENFYWKNYSLNCLVFVKLNSGMSSGVLAISSFECMCILILFFLALSLSPSYGHSFNLSSHHYYWTLIYYFCLKLIFI
jgi:hypothetical protein